MALVYPLYSIEQEQKRHKEAMEKLCNEILGLETKRVEMCKSLEVLQLKAENAKLKGDKQAAARYSVEAVSLEVELKDLRQQIEKKRIEELEKMRTTSRLPFPFLPLTLA